MTVSVNFRVRSAGVNDQRQLANLIHFSPYVHRHLDWRSPMEWIGSTPFLVAESQGELVAALACPPDPPKVAWVRLFVNDGSTPREDTWHRLWEAMREELADRGDFIVPAIVLHDWMQDLLVLSHFISRQEIVMLERDQNPIVGQNLPEGVAVRMMVPSDLPRVAQVDAAAFEPVWQNSLDALNRAFPQALLSTVAETREGVIGYQISTRNPFGAHLARLAVRPDLQRRGVGHALVEDLIHRLALQRITRLTVNTQSDNPTSLSLYKRTGFAETGERYPVYTFQIS